MRTLTRGLMALALALLMAMGAAGAAWATFTSAGTSPVSVSTLRLQPPSNIVRASCSSGSTRTLGVSYTASPSVQVVNNRPPSNPVQELTYFVTVTTSGVAGQASGTLADDRTGFSVTRNVGTTASRQWTVTITTSFAGWTSAPVVAVLSC